MQTESHESTSIQPFFGPKQNGNFTWRGGIVYLDGISREESLWSEEFNAGFVNSEDTAKDN